jgi:hypothetical protein
MSNTSADSGMLVRSRRCGLVVLVPNVQMTVRCCAAAAVHTLRPCHTDAVRARPRISSENPNLELRWSWTRGGHVRMIGSSRSNEWLGSSCDGSCGVSSGISCRTELACLAITKEQWKA